MQLRHQTCATGAPVCEGCALLAQCVYPRIMHNTSGQDHGLAESSETPNPYIIFLQPGDAGHQQIVQLTLFGRAIEHQALIIRALKTAGAKGLGKQRQSWQCSDTQNLEATAIAPVPTRAKIELLSPLVMRSKGHSITPDTFSFRDWLASLLRRYSLLCQHFDNPANIPSLDDVRALIDHSQHIHLDARALRWKQGYRWSSRQKRKIPIGGLVGSFTLEGDLTPLWPWLWLGQTLHVGRGAVMGQGAYRIQIQRKPQTWLITRHPGAVEYMNSSGMAFDQQRDHLDTDDVCAGDVVIGTLPINLVARVCEQGARYYHLSLELPAHLRGQELSAEQLQNLGARLEEYHVQRMAPGEVS